MNRWSQLDAWIQRGFRVDSAGLALFRIFFSLFILLLKLPVALWVAGLPGDFYRPPPGLPRLFGGFPSYELLFVLNAALALAAFCLLIGLRARVASLAVGCILMILNAAFYSLGKINHDNLVVILPLLFAFSSWGERFSVERIWSLPKIGTNPERDSCLMAYFSLLICVGMFQSGLIKLITGWWRPDTLTTLGYLLTIQEWQYQVDIGMMLRGNTSQWFWKLMDYSAVVFELSFIFGILCKRRFLILLSIACTFHFANALIFGIPFGHNLVAYAAFLDWSWLANRLDCLLTRASRSVTRGLALAIALVILLAAGTALNQAMSVDAMLNRPLLRLLSAGSLLIGLCYLFRPLARWTVVMLFPTWSTRLRETAHLDEARQRMDTPRIAA